MLEFLAVNFNLPTLIGAAVVFGGTGWLLWRTVRDWHKRK